MPVNLIDYDNPAVDGAVNPSRFGYHHGPIPNPNPGWNPRPDRADGRPGTGPVTVAQNAAAPRPGSVLSSINSGVCFIEVDSSHEMCGFVASSQSVLRRHIRDVHPGATVNRDRRNTTHDELRAGRLALKLFVRSGEWRRARFTYEPMRGATSDIGLINQYATDMEALAVQDDAFCASYGKKFHRDLLPSTTGPQELSPEPTTLTAAPEKRKSTTSSSDKPKMTFVVCRYRRG